MVLRAVLVCVVFSCTAAAQSVSLGSPTKGSLRDGVSLPGSGPGFLTYSTLGNWLGRQYVNSRVRDTLLEAFSALHAGKPERTFVVGETGLKGGGRFRPHKTHQNGLSVDIFMPVRQGSRWVPMPTGPWNKFGYALEFDGNGHGEGLSIDFQSVAELVVELERESTRHGLVLDRVIVAPEYVDRILAAKADGIGRLSAAFMRTPAWVRHDEHLHVDFRLAGPSSVR